MLKYPQFCERFLYTGCAVHKLGVRGRTLVKPFVKCILYLFYAIKSHKSASYMGADAALRFLRLVLWDHLQQVGECGACLALFGYLQIVRIVLHFRNGSPPPAGKYGELPDNRCLLLAARLPFKRFCGGGLSARACLGTRRRVPIYRARVARQGGHPRGKLVRQRPSRRCKPRSTRAG